MSPPDTQWAIRNFLLARLAQIARPIGGDRFVVSQVAGGEHFTSERRDALVSATAAYGKSRWPRARTVLKAIVILPFAGIFKISTNV
ncbi:hypothetical protein C5Y93_21415 [Blastopirellula marina]|uniref:Uncharacterized protein n=2 Tax=Blastopirellula marina TaxID=124 RepID=A0A2S8GI38_9BACT|nr:hypothetical protein C5Y93_21415 [Blastopirellula marina]